MKRILAIFLVSVLAVLSLCACNGESSDNNSAETKTEAEEVEPQYVEFSDIEIQVNQKSNFFYEVESYEDFSFEEIDDNGDFVDWTDEEKQELWNDCVEENFSNKILQAIYTSDIIELHSLPLSEAKYDNVDGFVNDFTSENTDFASKEDFNIGDIHACVVSWDETEDVWAWSMLTFIYKDNVYIIAATSILTDIETLTEETIDAIKLN